MQRRLFIVGTQGIPARYGGLETFAEELAIGLVRRGFEVYVTCEDYDPQAETLHEYQGVRLLRIPVPKGNLRTIIGDVRALRQCLQRATAGDVIYLLGYGVGPFCLGLLNTMRRRQIAFWLNPDGLEWQRPRWSAAARRYLKFSEGLLVKRADLVVCDAAAIAAHHERVYGVPSARLAVAEYGAWIDADRDLDEEVQKRRARFLEAHGTGVGAYYTYVGRFVPDNNMELMVRGFLESETQRQLLVLARHDERDPFYQHLRQLVEASGRPERVLFTGGVYEKDLLQAIRKGERGYLHGHEVGGTNPALVEAMGLGSFVIALGTVYNKEVLGDAGLFFDKSDRSFREALARAEAMTPAEREQYRQRALGRVRDHYNWERICSLYAELLGTGTMGTGKMIC